MRHHARALTIVLMGVLIGALAGCGVAGTPSSRPASTPGQTPAGKMAAGSARLSDGDSGKTVELAAGGELVIDLEENPTTGFGWSVGQPLPSVLATSDDVYRSPEDQGLVGAAGRRILTYDAVTPGEGELTITYARPWESVPPPKTFTATVVVK